MSVVINYGGFNAYVTGDMIHHPCQIAYPEWGTYYDVDKELAMKTRKRFLEKNAEQDSIIIGTHFSGSSIGKIIKDGDNMLLIYYVKTGKKLNGTIFEKAERLASRHPSFEANSIEVLDEISGKNLTRPTLGIY